jgi:hypothetical protein
VQISLKKPQPCTHHKFIILVHQIWYLVWLSIWIYTVLFFLLLKLISYRVKLSMFYNVQTINLTFVGKIWDVQ